MSFRNKTTELVVETSCPFMRMGVFILGTTQINSPLYKNLDVFLQPGKSSELDLIRKHLGSYIKLVSPGKDTKLMTIQHKPERFV